MDFNNCFSELGKGQSTEVRNKMKSAEGRSCTVLEVWFVKTVLILAVCLKLTSWRRGGWGWRCDGVLPFLYHCWNCWQLMEYDMLWKC